MTSPLRAHGLGFVLSCLVTWTTSQNCYLPVEKLGQCPLDVDYPDCKSVPIGLKHECDTDGDCEGTRKCCYSGCRNLCLLPLQGKPGTCPYYNASQCILIKPIASECHEDKQCQGSDRCCCSGCRRVCTSTVIVKPGQCPVRIVKCPFEEIELSSAKVSIIDPPVVKPRCKNDCDCCGTQKCCDSCGMKCVEPIKDHPGFCPICNEQISCITMLGKPSCRTDADCKTNQKCCLSKDRMQCVLPLKEKKGCCPKLSTFPVCAYPPPPSKCLSDSDCPGKQKCCFSACQKTCTDPIPAVKPGTCPVTNTLIACKVPPPPGDCKKDCDCPDKKKCCIQGCVFRCVDV